MTTLCLCDYVDVAALSGQELAKLPTAPASTARVLIAIPIDPRLLPRRAAIHTIQDYLP
jgi:hypothetical protein